MLIITRSEDTRCAHDRASVSNVGNQERLQLNGTMEYYSSLDASQLDSETPTVFEIISANQLEALLSPSLRYILVHYAQRYPGYLLRIANRFDEINLGLRTLIEWYFMKYWRGSFTENFYGLKRVSQTPLSQPKYNLVKLSQLAPSLIEEGRKLSKLQMWISIFEITGTSYILEKLGYQYELLYSKYATNQLEITGEMDGSEIRKVWMQRKFVEVYPYLQGSWRAANLLTTLLYLGGDFKSPTLLTALFKINLSRLNQSDYARNEPKLATKKNKPNRITPPTNTELALNYVRRNLVKPTSTAVKVGLGTFFPLAIFSLKFLEWWNNSDFAHQLAKSQNNALEGSIPPPSIIASLSKVEAHTKSIYKLGPLCPLCHEEIQNPAIIETGYVFCYTCIYNYLRESHKHQRPKTQLSDTESESDSEDNQDEAEMGIVQNKDSMDELEYHISKGGRCPITGRKLLGCKYNPLTDEFDVEGVRRLIF